MPVINKVSTVKEIKRPRILVVDDTSDNIELLVGILKKDYQILAATSGETALNIIEKQALPDLILLDIMMPNMNGYQVLRKLKNSERTKMIPVIFVTAMAEIKDETKGLMMGAVDYITKPIQPDIVKARVRTHLQLLEATDHIQDLLDNTLTGTVSLLTDIIALSHPKTAMKATAIRKHMQALARNTGLQSIWQYDLAAMLSHIGFMALTPSNVKNIESGRVVYGKEYEMFQDHPNVAARLLQHVSQLSTVGTIIQGQKQKLEDILTYGEMDDFVTNGIGRVDLVTGGVFLLRLSILLEETVQKGNSRNETYQIHGSKFRLNAPALSKLLIDISGQGRIIRPLEIAELQSGMVLEKDLYTKKNALLMRAGTEITYAGIERINTFENSGGLVLPIIVSWDEDDKSIVDPGTKPESETAAEGI